MKITVLIPIILLFAACEKIQTKKTTWPNGNPKEEWEVTQDEFGEDIKNGLYRSWFENGKLQYEIHYLDDKKHGMQKSFFSNGKQELEENYLFGKLNGKKKNWTISGNLELEVDFVDGKQYGKFIRYRESGKIHHEISYENGLKHGAHKIYDVDGNLEQTTWHNQGKIVDVPPGSSDSSSASLMKGKNTSIAETKPAQVETKGDEKPEAKSAEAKSGEKSEVKPADAKEGEKTESTPEGVTDDKKKANEVPAKPADSPAKSP